MTGKREPGFYWVLTQLRRPNVFGTDHPPEWLVAEWDGYNWGVPGMDGIDYRDDQMQEIRRERITMSPEAFGCVVTVASALVSPTDDPQPAAPEPPKA